MPEKKELERDEYGTLYDCKTPLEAAGRHLQNGDVFNAVRYLLEHVSSEKSNPSNQEGDDAPAKTSTKKGGHA